MKKSDIIAALGKINGDPEIEIRCQNIEVRHMGSGFTFNTTLHLIIERINEFPIPEIVAIKK